ncbi:MULTISPECIES: hypothetical protein [unclassified Bradyrhizobium]|uniref:hypothetical protein n=1 Tax=unclassified Bradyrhizobium TaxID=2631580 RepID=UPI001FFAD966|nr:MULTISPECIES: hypothetical protein [unclassified Bradyrhizobium]MCK1714864.1 hypothetical protein [Bradyrhizobium sp. 143]MCK1728422.1 hypothetical protein [Bradyrhizobium sp. 142]
MQITSVRARPDLDGEEAVGDEVVEFEHVADGGGQCCALDLYGFAICPQTTIDIP